MEYLRDALFIRGTHTHRDGMGEGVCVCVCMTSGRPHIGFNIHYIVLTVGYAHRLILFNCANSEKNNIQHFMTHSMKYLITDRLDNHTHTQSGRKNEGEHRHAVHHSICGF